MLFKPSVDCPEEPFALCLVDGVAFVRVKDSPVNGTSATVSEPMSGTESLEIRRPGGFVVTSRPCRRVAAASGAVTVAPMRGGLVLGLLADILDGERRDGFP